MSLLLDEGANRLRAVAPASHRLPIVGAFHSVIDRPLIVRILTDCSLCQIGLIYLGLLAWRYLRAGKN
jgi:hypothetical protein